MDTWVGLVMPLMGLHDEDVAWVPGTGGHFCLAGNQVTQQCVHNGFRSTGKGSSGYFALVTSSDI